MPKERDAAFDDQAAATQAPGTETLIADLTALWQSALELDSVTPQANFFKLGGDSLIAIDILAALRQQYSVTLTLRSFFENPTVGLQAAAISAQIAAGLTSDTGLPQLIGPGIARQARSGAAGTSLLQESQIIVCADLADPSYVERDIAQISGPLDVDALRQAFTCVLRRHDSLRMSFPRWPDPGFAEIADAEGSHWPFRLLDLTGLAADERDRRAAREVDAFGRTADLRSGPVVDGMVIKLEPELWILGLAVDHIVSDLISGEILGNEVSAAYASLRGGGEPELPAVPFQYQDYANAQRAWLQTAPAIARRDHWLRRWAEVGSSLPVLRIRPQFRRDPAAVGELTAVQRTLDHTFGKLFDEYCGRRGVTRYAAWLTAALLSLRPFTDSDLIGMRINHFGRDWPGTEQLIGFFAQSVPLWLTISEDMTFADVAPAAQQQVAETIDNSLPMLYLQRERAAAGGPPARTKDDITSELHVPHVNFMCDPADHEGFTLSGTAVGPYPCTPDRPVDFSPVVYLKIGMSQACWNVRIVYVADGHFPEVMTAWLDSMVGILEQEVRER